MTNGRMPNQERLLQQLIEDRKKFTEGKSDKVLRAYREFFTSELGRIILADLEVSYGGISLVPGYSDVTAFKEGRRSVVDDIRMVLKLAEAVDRMPPQNPGR